MQSYRAQKRLWPRATYPLALAEIEVLTPAPAAQMAAWKALAEQKLARQNALLSLRRLIEG
jgi:hypothetical protein